MVRLKRAMDISIKEFFSHIRLYGIVKGDIFPSDVNVELVTERIYKIYNGSRKGKEQWPLNFDCIASLS